MERGGVLLYIHISYFCLVTSVGVNGVRYLGRCKWGRLLRSVGITAEDFLEAVEFSYGSIGLVLVLILEFGNPDDVRNSPKHGNNRNHPPDQCCKGGRTRMNGKGDEHSPTLVSPLRPRSSDWELKYSQICWRELIGD